MSKSLLPILAFLFVGHAASFSKTPREPNADIVEKGGTLFLNDPALLKEQPMLLPTPTPTPAAAPRATPGPEKNPPASRRAESDPVHIPAGSLRSTSFQHPSRTVAVTAPGSPEKSALHNTQRNTGLVVETTIPYPIQFSPAQVRASSGGGVVIIPATPTRFTTGEVGTRWGSNGFRSRDLQGFIDYGSPIRAVIPVYDSQGRTVGFRAIETPNPVLQPVFRSIEINR